MNLKSFKANMTVLTPRRSWSLRVRRWMWATSRWALRLAPTTSIPPRTLSLRQRDAAFHVRAIKPEVTASYAGSTTPAPTGPTARCPTAGRHGRRDGYFRYDLSNDSEYEMKGFGMDVVVNGATKQNDGTRDAWRGFLARSVVIPGFSYGKTSIYDANDNVTGEETRWHYNYGSVTSVDSSTPTTPPPPS